MAPSATEIQTQDYVSVIVKNDKHDKYKSCIRNDGVAIGKSLVWNALKERVNGIDTDTCEPGEDEAFFVADLGEVYRQHLRWKKNLRQVKPHYAVKCNPDPVLLGLLAKLGTGFDCASKTEIDTVLKLGVAPERIIYAQPCKTKSHIRHAATVNVRQMTFDNADELYKIAALFPDAELYLRIQTDDSSSLCRLSLKYGAPLDSTAVLLDLAMELNLNVVGVSFHVGSGASDPSSFVGAVRDARTVFDQAAAAGFRLHTLDVGGGFTSDALFETMAAHLAAALDAHFPPTAGVRIIGEPGRYFAASAYTLACNVIARRDVRDVVEAPAPAMLPATGTVIASTALLDPTPAIANVSYMLYLNDGVYGNFSSIIFDHQHPRAQVLSCRSRRSAAAAEGLPVSYSLWGPTCDGIDRIAECAELPALLNVGDWLFFEEMGAYTRCSATRFNGFRDQHDVLYVCSEPAARAVLGW